MKLLPFADKTADKISGYLAAIIHNTHPLQGWVNYGSGSRDKNHLEEWG